VHTHSVAHFPYAFEPVSSIDPAPPLLPDEFTGQKLGAYEVIRRLSTGGMAEIFLALRLGEGGFRKLVVLKRILHEVAQDEDFVARLLEEGRLMGDFSHPNIAQVFDVGKDGGEYFLVMEFVAGVSLLELLRLAAAEKELLPVAFTLAVGRSAALALHHAHAFVDAQGRPHPVIHRDVAPKNIMVTFEGHLKLLDFGVAKTELHRTGVGALVGTPAYMSPEQASLMPMDPRSDVFSLAATLHECLTGRRLFAAPSVQEELQAVAQRPVPPPSRWNREVTAELDEMILRGLARDRAERFSSASDFAHRLESAGGMRPWGPERVAAVVQRFFPERNDQMRRLLQGARDGLTAPDLLTRSGLTGIGPDAPTVMEERRSPSRAAKPLRKRVWAWALGAGLAFGLIALALSAVAVAVRKPPKGEATTSAPLVAPAPSELPAAPPEVPASPPTSPSAVARPPAALRPPISPHHRPAEETGVLWVRVRPWARVYLDGRLKGETPLDPFTLSAGRHSVLLVNESLKVKKTYDVEVHTNEQRELRAVLDER
jgi:serine/threonine protein kinase